MRNALLALALAGCMVPPAATATTTNVSASSRTILGPQGSGAVTLHPLDDTAREVAHLFETRGFVLLDQHVDAPNGERLLKLSKTNRDLVGDVFYAWIAPTPTGSTVSLLGKATVLDLEPCTDDGVALPCSPLESFPAYLDLHFTGLGEAEIAHGILSELELEGYAIAPLPADAPPPTGDPAALACKAARHQQLLDAVASPDPTEKRSILDHLPSC